MNLNILGNQLRTLKPYYIWIVLLSLFCSTLVCAWNPPVKPTMSISVTPTGGKNSISNGTEIWVQSIGETTASTYLSAQYGWEAKDGQLVSRGNLPASLVWNEKLSSSFTLTLGTNSYSGIVEVSIGTKSKTIDLYSPAPSIYILKANELIALTSGSSLFKIQLSLLFMACFAFFTAVFMLLFAAALKYNWLSGPTCDYAGNSSYINRLDHLRFLAASLIIMYHFFYNFTPVGYQTSGLLDGLVSQGHTAVGLFMVISGFVFGIIGYNKTINYKNFIFNRFIRIYPLYLFACFVAYSANHTTVSGLDLLFYFFPFVNPKLTTIPFFGQTWSIGVEFLFYMCFPFLNRFISRYGFRYIAAFLLLSLFLKLFYFLNTGTVRDLAYWTILGRIDQFLVGILFAHLYKERFRVLASPIHLLISAAVVIGVIYGFNRVGGYFLIPNSGIWVVWPLLESLFWAYFVLSYINCALSIPKWADITLTRLGAMSFSMYMMHNIIIRLVVLKLGFIPLLSSTGANIVLTSITVVIPAVCIISYFTYHLIEKPFSAYRMKYVSPEHSNG